MNKVRSQLQVNGINVKLGDGREFRVGGFDHIDH
jgi:hypothetical protein